jgi:hypothetical protein
MKHCQHKKLLDPTVQVCINIIIVRRNKEENEIYLEGMFQVQKKM